LPDAAGGNPAKGARNNAAPSLESGRTRENSRMGGRRQGLPGQRATLRDFHPSEVQRRGGQSEATRSPTSSCSPWRTTTPEEEVRCGKAQAVASTGGYRRSRRCWTAADGRTRASIWHTHCVNLPRQRFLFPISHPFLVQAMRAGGRRPWLRVHPKALRPMAWGELQAATQGRQLRLIRRFAITQLSGKMRVIDDAADGGQCWGCQCGQPICCFSPCEAQWQPGPCDT
jgi:hypothetical protein